MTFQRKVMKRKLVPLYTIFALGSFNIHARESVVMAPPETETLRGLFQKRMKQMQRHRRRLAKNSFERENGFIELELPADDAATKQFTLSSACELNAGGLYGRPFVSSQVYEVQFLYQIYVTTGTSEATIRARVSPELDRIVTEGILPAFFSCDRRRSLQNAGNGIIDAISSRPPDQIAFFSLRCARNSVPTPGTDCYIVEGALSVFARGFNSQEQLESIVSAEIRRVIQGDALSNGIELIQASNNLNEDLSVAEPLPSPVGPSPTVAPPTTPAPTVIETPTAPAPANTRMPTRTPTLPPSRTQTASPTLRPTQIPRGPPAPPLPTRPVPSRPAPDGASFTFPPNLGGITASPVPVPTETPSFTPTTINGTMMTPGTPDGLFTAAPSPMGMMFTATPTMVSVVDTRSTSDGGLDWWAWLLIVFAGVGVLYCGYTVWSNREGGDEERRDIGGSGAKSDEFGFANDDYEPPSKGFGYMPPITPVQDNVQVIEPEQAPIEDISIGLDDLNSSSSSGSEEEYPDDDDSYDDDDEEDDEDYDEDNEDYDEEEQEELKAPSRIGAAQRDGSSSSEQYSDGDWDQEEGLGWQESEDDDYTESYGGPSFGEETDYSDSYGYE